MEIFWKDGFEIKVTDDQEIVIEANREGLMSLAYHLTALADATPGTHIHYDQYNSLEEGSKDLIIVRTASKDEKENSEEKK